LKIENVKCKIEKEDTSKIGIDPIVSLLDKWFRVVSVPTCERS
jgi:hypothetical protein